MSGATVLIVKGALYIFLALNLLRLPGRPMLQHGVENRQELVHARREGDFLDFTSGQQTLVEGPNHWVETCRHERAHVQHGAHMRAASPNGAPTPHGPTVAIEGRHTDQGRDLLPRERPQLGEFQHQRPGTHGPNARGTL